MKDLFLTSILIFFCTVVQSQRPRPQLYPSTDPSKTENLILTENDFTTTGTFSSNPTTDGTPWETTTGDENDSFTTSADDIFTTTTSEVFRSYIFSHEIGFKDS